MADVVETHEEASGEHPPLIVREPLTAFFDEHGLGSGEIEVERIGEGHSNITFLVRRGDDRYVLRRPPRPPLPPSAHDMLREAKLLRAMQDSPARVPELLAVCDDESVLGVDFYVMGYIEGSVITGEIPEALDNPDGRRDIGLELIDTLAEIHAVDWEAGGLGDFGKPTGYLDRQLKRFNGLWEHNKTREVERVQEIAQWLADNKPESPPATIVHGDYRLGNVMVANDPPARILAVFDWELSTIGDPLADVGYLTVTWAEAGDPEDTMWTSFNAVTRREGFPTRDELIARYQEKSGRSVGDLRWYQTLALWKAAVFMEGNFKRYKQGASDDEYLGLFDEGVPALAEAAWDIARSPAPSQ